MENGLEIHCHDKICGAGGSPAQIVIIVFKVGQ